MALDRVTNSANPPYPDKIVMVDMEDGAGLDYSIDTTFPYNHGDMYDDLHPNDSGYDKDGPEMVQFAADLSGGGRAEARSPSSRRRALPAGKASPLPATWAPSPSPTVKARPSAAWKPATSRYRSPHPPGGACKAQSAPAETAPRSAMESPSIWVRLRTSPAPSPMVFGPKGPREVIWTTGPALLSASVFWTAR